MKELLLLGGSHQASLISYLKDINGFKKPLKNSYHIKAVGCSDLDLVNNLKIDQNSNLILNQFQQLAQSCIEEYGIPYISYDPERIICLSIGSWHRAISDPIWQTHYPAEIEPDINQVTPISTYEVINRVYNNVFIRLSVIISLLLSNKLNLFVVIAPPIPITNEGSNLFIPIKTAKYINFLCYKMYTNALKTLNIKYIDIVETVLDQNGYLKFEYCYRFADSHGNNKYGSLVWKQILNLLDENNWNPESFHLNNSNYIKFSNN
ncbi:MAG: hypothetical protein LBT86_00890 [Deltaproteobacteria bacterium]|jgi:hypothetical protein|nr:hypothetical protein [Deltaproteobacteria bacterium]